MPVDAAQVRTLVGAQLRLDLRHPTSGRTQTSRAVLTVAAYTFSAAVLALSLAERGATLGETLAVGLAFASTLAAFGVAGSYDDLMGRPTEHAQLLALPIGETTLYAARLVNVALLALAMAASAALPLGAYAAWAYGGAAGVAFAGAIVATMLLATATTLAAIWSVALAVPPRALRGALVGARTFLVGALVLGYQAVGLGPALPTLPAAAATPAAAASLAVLVAGLGLLYGAVFPRRYVQLLGRTAEAERDHAARPSGVVRLPLWTRVALRDAAGRAGYGLARAALRSDRLVRGRVGPVLGMAFLFGAFGVWSDGLGSLLVHGAAEALVEPAVRLHVSVLAILLFAAQSAAQALQVSDRPEAAWVYATLPASSARGLQLGAQHALLLHALLPLHIALAGLLALAMPIGHALLHAACWLAGCALLTRTYALTRRTPPLARRSDRFAAGERLLPLLLAVPAALALLLLQGVAFAHPASAVLLVAGLFVLHAALGQLPGRPGHATVGPSPEPVLAARL